MRKRQQQYLRSQPIRVTLDGISAYDVRRLMRKHKATIRSVATFLNVTMKTVRRWRERGLSFLGYLELVESCRGQHGLTARESAMLATYRIQRMSG